MAQSHNANAARSNQVPPTIRKWVADHADEVDSISRWNGDNESYFRGWNVCAKSVSLKELPDGFRFGRVGDRDGDFDGIRLQIREDW